MKIEDAIFWEKVMQSQGCKDIKILVS